MNSRRTLLMVGVPDLSDQAFVRHGRNIQPQIGGGGSAPKQPTSTTQTVNNVPAFIQPYVESMLGRAQALGTDAQYEPFDPSQRFEGTTGLQQQSYDRAASMGTNPMLDQAGQWAQNAMTQAGQASQYADPLMNQALNFGNAAAGMGNQYNQAVTDPSQVGNFMSPYMQNVVDVQKQEAIRDYQSQLPSMQAAATNAGAFGGSRHAILEAEGQRNLNQNLSDIQARGSQFAYDQAMQSMQFGSNLGMQGYQTGLQGVGQGINAAQLGLAGVNAQLQGAGTLGQLGQTQYNQQMGITELQNAMGTQQQQQGQQQRDFNYQQFLDELNFPYQQLGFMSDMTRGLPLSQSTVYQNNAQPNQTSQLIGGGLAAYGLLNRAKGGIIPKPKKKYAQGGQVDGSAFSGMNVDEITATLESLSDEQLAQYAATVQDAVTLSLIRAENERRARLRQQPAQMPQSTVAQDVAQQATPGGIAAMVPQQQPQQPQQPMLQQAMRAGGIVALAEGGRVDRRTQAERDREILGNWGQSFAGGAAKAGAAAADIFTLPVRGAMGAANTLIRVPNAFGLEVPYIPEAAFGGSSTSMTPYLDQLRDPNAEQGPPVRVDISGVTPPVPGTEVNPHEIYRTDTPAPAQAPAQQAAPQRAAPATPAQAGQGRAATPAPATPVVPQQGQPASTVPTSFDEYEAGVQDRATQSLEEKMMVDAMRAGLDERQARVEVADRRGKMDALIAAGAAMMSGTSVADGLARGAGAGVEALRDATKSQERMEEGLTRAKEEQLRYELALRKDNQKEARDAYSNWLKYDQKNTELAQDYQLKLMSMASNERVAGMYASRGGGGGGAEGLSIMDMKRMEDAVRDYGKTVGLDDYRKNPRLWQMQHQGQPTPDVLVEQYRERLYNQMAPGVVSPGAGVAAAAAPASSAGWSVTGVK